MSGERICFSHGGSPLQASRGYVLDTGYITHAGAPADFLASDAEIRAADLGIEQVR